MAWDLFSKLVREISDFRADVNLFLGGESLLHPRLPEMIALCREKQVPSRLYTNATLLDDEKSEAIIRAGLDHITFSFDGVERGPYEEFRKGARFEKTLKNIQTFLAVKKKLRTRSPSVVIQCMELGGAASSQVSKRKFKGLFDPKMVKFTFIRPHSFGGVYKEITVEREKRKYSPCAFLWYSMTVAWDGTVVPCCVDLFGKYPLGNATEHTLWDLWNGERMITLRKQIHASHYRQVDLCSDCDILWKKRFLGIPIKSYYNLLDIVRNAFHR